MSNILHLTLKKQWFDLILSGEKTEEYREMKVYWYERLVDHIDYEQGFDELFPTLRYRHFDIIRFTNGYSKNAPTFDIECKGVYEGPGKPEWGAEPGVRYFIISLGNIISKSNLK